MTVFSLTARFSLLQASYGGLESNNGKAMPVPGTNGDQGAQYLLIIDH